MDTIEQLCELLDNKSFQQLSIADQAYQILNFRDEQGNKVLLERDPDQRLPVIPLGIPSQHYEQTIEDMVKQAGSRSKAMAISQRKSLKS